MTSPKWHHRSFLISLPLAKKKKKKKSAYIFDENVKWCSTMENSLMVLQKAKHRMTIWFANFRG